MQGAIVSVTWFVDPGALWCVAELASGFIPDEYLMVNSFKWMYFYFSHKYSIFMNKNGHSDGHFQTIYFSQ